MKGLRSTLTLCFLMHPAFLGQQKESLSAPPDNSGRSALCTSGSLPQQIQNRLTDEFRSWKIQQSADLSPRARGRWESEKPLQCPGIAAGQFEATNMKSYAVLLVPEHSPDAGYKFLVFSPKVGAKPSFEMKALEQWDGGGAANFFIRSVPIHKFFNQASRRKFQVQTTDGILLFDSAENEYETDVYFWANSGYQHEPIDY